MAAKDYGIVAGVETAQESLAKRFAYSIPAYVSDALAGLNLPETFVADPYYGPNLGPSGLAQMAEKIEAFMVDNPFVGYDSVRFSLVPAIIAEFQFQLAERYGREFVLFNLMLQQL